jgi:hypothetical protein
VKSVEVCYGARKQRLDHPHVGPSEPGEQRHPSDRRSNGPARRPELLHDHNPVPTITEGGVSLAISLNYTAAGEQVFSTVSTTWAPASEALD